MAAAGHKPAFAITSYKDGDLALRSIEALRILYPGSPIIHIPDEPRLKLPQFCGLWTERWMRAVLETDAQILVKLDPDTRAVRRANFPDAEMFGQLAPPESYWGMEGVIYGGCIGFSRSCVERFLASGLLREERYSVRPYYTDRGDHGRVSLQDPIVADVGKRLGVVPAHWPGLHMRLKWEPFGEVDDTATFVHPVID